MIKDQQGDSGADEPRASLHGGGDEPDWRLLSRCISGAATASEHTELARWIGSDEHRVRFVDEVRAVWRGAGTPTAPLHLDSALTKIKANAPQSPKQSPTRTHPLLASSRPIRRRLGQTVVAASVGAAAIVAISFVGRARERPASTQPSISTVSTLRAERARVRLPDGSDVVLGPLSTLRYASDYGVARREVNLRGRALFTVRHDSVHAFVVRTDRMTVSDVGTRFLVSEYPENRAPEVAVSEGAVAIAPARDSAAATQSTLLRAGDVASITKDGRVRVSHPAAVSQYLAWTEGQLVFKNAPLREALAELSRWYEADLRLSNDSDDTLASATLTATIQDEPLAQVSALLRATFDLTSTQEVLSGRRVVIFKPSRQSNR